MEGGGVGGGGPCIELELVYLANTGYIPEWFTGWPLWCPGIISAVSQHFLFKFYTHLRDTWCCTTSPVEKFVTYEFSKVQGFLVDLASHGVPLAGLSSWQPWAKYVYTN